MTFEGEVPVHYDRVGTVFDLIPALRPSLPKLLWSKQKGKAHWIDAAVEQLLSEQATRARPPARPARATGKSAGLLIRLDPDTREMIQAIAQAARARQPVRIRYRMKVTTGIPVYRTIHPYSLRVRSIHVNGYDNPPVPTIVFFGYDPFKGCFSGDTLVSLVDGTEVPIRELVGRDPFWVYAYDHKTGKIVPGRATARRTQQDAELVEVELDNGKRVRCTPDHLWMLRDGSYKQAQELQPDDSLMPLYRSIDPSGHRQVKSIRSGKWFPFYVVTVSSKPPRFIGIRAVRHHIDFNPLNDTPENLVWLSLSEHQTLHMRSISDETRAKMSASALGRVSPRLGCHLSKATKRKISETKKESKFSHTLETRWRISQALKGRKRSEATREKQRLAHKLRWKRYSKAKREAIRSAVRASLQDPEVREKLRRNRRGKGVGNTNASGPRTVETRARISSKMRAYCETHPDIMKEKARRMRQARLMHSGPVRTPVVSGELNHKVVAVHCLAEREDCYDLSVEKYHNFALTAGVFVHNSIKMFVADRIVSVERKGTEYTPSWEIEFESEVSPSAYQRFARQVLRDAVQKFAARIMQAGGDPLDGDTQLAGVGMIGTVLGLSDEVTLEFAQRFVDEYDLDLPALGGELGISWSDLPAQQQQLARAMSGRFRGVKEMTTAGSAGGYEVPLGMVPAGRASTTFPHRKKRKKRKKRKEEADGPSIDDIDWGGLDNLGDEVGEVDADWIRGDLLRDIPGDTSIELRPFTLGLAILITVPDGYASELARKLEDRGYRIVLRGDGPVGGSTTLFVRKR